MQRKITLLCAALNIPGACSENILFKAQGAYDNAAHHAGRQAEVMRRLEVPCCLSNGFQQEQRDNQEETERTE